jgi:hypothetical protein
MRRLAFLLVCCSGLLGCGPAKGRVSGTVLCDGKMVMTGTVTFFVEGSPPVSGWIGADGRYQATNVPTGEAIVVVISAAGGEEPAKARKPDRTDPKRADQDKTASKSAIPEKYNDPNTTDLKFTVQKGDNTFDITLTR